MKKSIKVTKITQKEYSAILRKPKQEILAGILFRVHSLTIKDDKYTLTNAYFESRVGNFEVI